MTKICPGKKNAPAYAYVMLHWLEGFLSYRELQIKTQTYSFKKKKKEINIPKHKEDVLA